jgi:GNAT superfamily N-acetyltransferase
VAQGEGKRRQLRKSYQYITPERICRRMVAVNPHDEVIGYAVAIHETYYLDGEYYVWVGIEPLWQGQGGGALLYADAESFLRLQNVTSLRSEVRDDNPLALQFAEQRGFRIENHLFGSTLDLLAFDDRPYHSLLADLDAQGIRFCSLADFGDSPEARRKLYDVNRATSLDDPASSGTFMAFEDFLRWICGAEWYRPEGQLIAAEGDRWVGLAAVHLLPDKHEATGQRHWRRHICSSMRAVCLTGQADRHRRAARRRG